MTRATPERDLQRAAIAWLKAVLPGCVVAAVPNEQRGTGTALQRMRYGAARKASGVLTGMPDLLLFLPARTVFVEMKAPGGILSEAQQELHARLTALGFAVIVADSIEALRHGLHGAGVVTREAPGLPMRPAKVRRAKGSGLSADQVPF